MTRSSSLRLDEHSSGGQNSEEAGLLELAAELAQRALLRLLLAAPPPQHPATAAPIPTHSQGARASRG